jgi:gas vesicle protein
MTETNINVTDALRGQQEQLKRLIAQQNWLREASNATLEEISAQVNELKRLLDELQSEVERRLKTVR